MSIAQNIERLRSEIPQHVTLVAISKTHPPTAILEAYNAGQRIFGENKVQELTSKYNVLPKDIQWHLVGHLQTNKVKYITPFVSLIHSVDSLKLLVEINKSAAKHNRVIGCLFQMHIAEEETKFGLTQNELEDILNSDELKTLNNVTIDGLMGMATFTENMEQVRKEFRNLKSTFTQIKEKYFCSKPQFNTLSMGMSSDYGIAVGEGSTMIRVGSSIFGERNYGSN